MINSSCTLSNTTLCKLSVLSVFVSVVYFSFPSDWRFKNIILLIVSKQGNSSTKYLYKIMEQPPSCEKSTGTEILTAQEYFLLKRRPETHMASVLATLQTNVKQTQACSFFKAWFVFTVCLQICEGKQR